MDGLGLISPDDNSPNGKNGGDLVQNKNIESISYCGLYCSKCVSYSDKIADTARDFKKDLGGARIDRSMEALSNAPPFEVFIICLACFEASGDLVKLRCNKACRSGGGPPECKIRNCCRKGGIDGCWQCPEFERCPKLESLSFRLGDSHLKNIRRLSQKEISAFMYEVPLCFSKIKERNTPHNVQYSYQ